MLHRAGQRTVYTRRMYYIRSMNATEMIRSRQSVYLNSHIPGENNTQFVHDHMLLSF